MRESPYNDLLTHASRLASAVDAAKADNCRFDELASEERWRTLEAKLPEPSSAGWSDWQEAHGRYFELRCMVSRPFVPDAFLDGNRGAWLETLPERQSLVRVEALSRHLQRGALELRELEELLQRTDDDATHVVRTFLSDWNQGRDARPVFATFAEEVEAEVASEDWPHALRDRLGLGHYRPTGDVPVPVALMRYSLDEVLAARTPAVGSAVAVPTVLDSGLDEFFFPVPQDHPYGATLHLGPGQADTFTAEVLHCRIEYEPHHIFRLGEISRPAPLGDAQLREVRDRHLHRLREVNERDDFGEPLKGRT